MRARLPLRLVRAAAFSAVCVTLAVLGHVVAGGSGPAAWAVAASGAAVMASAVPLAGRERSTAAISTGLAVLQVSLHELFALGDTTGPPPWHAHGGGLGESLGMLLAHLTATLITGWWLARGETVLWALLRSATRRLGELLGLVVFLLRPPAGAGTPRAYPHGASPVVRTVLRHCVSRRGPPLPAG
ncbi:MFS transporter [Streptosporangium sp. NPDC023615]|uniref:MFS transporter n=1 Tax=Streptosporangium sp. NPDC023615 TaxID=3154794 RepID=UPI00343FBD87